MKISLQIGFKSLRKIRVILTILMILWSSFSISTFAETQEESNSKEGRAYDYNAARDAYAYDSNIGYSNPKWMQSLVKDSIKLSELSIPGTHGSTALYGKTAIDEDWTRNQRMSITTQLNSGIRYLDIRARRTGDSFAMHHGPVYQHKMFGDILNEVTIFLQQNPSETVLMRLKEEHDAESGSKSFEEIMTKYWNDYQQYFWKPGSSNNPTLDEVRGKIVILQNFSSSAKFGVDYNSLKVQDQYEVRMNGMYDKWLAIKNHMNHAKNDQQSIYLNYLSGTGGGTGVKPWFLASGYESRNTNSNMEFLTTFNPWLYPDWPRIGPYNDVYYGGTNILFTASIKLHKEHVGIVAADFPGKGFIKSIIELNDRFKEKPDDYKNSIHSIVTPNSDKFEIGLTGQNYMKGYYKFRINGQYMGEVNRGVPYYGSLGLTNYGHKFSKSGISLANGDKIEVFVKIDGNEHLIKSHIVSGLNGPVERIQKAHEFLSWQSSIPIGKIAGVIFKPTWDQDARNLVERYKLVYTTVSGENSYELSNRVVMNVLSFGDYGRVSGPGIKVYAIYQGREILIVSK
ncbi:phosphatidylinositol-specific phospholipase C [Bacillus cereus]|uniref:1-phosphatidylinositol phosphodiesterase n=1 Tax=Bacillus cereus VD184 TaxID=1053242 RepID=A0A9W5R0B5_BACCE|nr:phosphatidylinositol-specific phospholipase C [Bacillus cereus]EOQ00432.1 hypothetical protein IKC_06512 [Bacillus cereus VD184]